MTVLRKPDGRLGARGVGEVAESAGGDAVRIDLRVVQVFRFAVGARLEQFASADRLLVGLGGLLAVLGARGRDVLADLLGDRPRRGGR